MVTPSIIRSIRSYTFLLLFVSTILVHAQPVSYDDVSYSMGTFFGNARNDSYLLHVAVDSAGFIYGTGFCLDIRTTTGVYQPARSGQFDIMVFKLDPTMRQLIWATYIGGGNNDAGGSIAVNNKGEVFVTGYTYSANFPTTVATDAAYLSNNTVNYFALKLSSDGSRLLYSRILGNGVVSSIQTALASKGAHVAINPLGEAFVYAHTSTPSRYTITPSAYQSTNAGMQDLVLTKLDSLGGILSSTFLGGVRNETASDICYAKGKLYFTGIIASTAVRIATGKTPDAGDSFVGVVDDAVPLVPRRLYVYGSTGSDVGIAVGYDNSAQRVCVTGTSAFGNFPYTKVLQNGMTTGGYIAALDSGLTGIQYCTLIGSNTIPTSIIARRNGSVYIAGYSNGSLPITPNAFQPMNRGGLDGMLISLDSTGQNVRYCTFIGGSSSDYSAAKVLLFEQSCVLRVIFGITSHSVNFPTTSDSFQPLKLNNSDDQPALALFSTISELDVSLTKKPCTREITANISTPCTPLDVIWNFGDGSPIRRGGLSQTYTYTRGGTYTVSITLVYPEPDSVIVRRTVTIEQPSQVDAGTDKILCLKQGAVTLQATGAIRYVWSPGTLLNDSTVSSPIAQPQKPTTFYVRGTHANGCITYDSVRVDVRELQAKAWNDTAICEGLTVNLRATGAANVVWSPPNGLTTIYGQSVLATPKQSTTYQAVVSDGICSETVSVRVTVYPVPRVRISAPQSLCMNLISQISATVTFPRISDSAGMKIDWRSSEQVTNPTSLSSTINPQKTAWYYCTVVTQYGCAVRDSVRIVVQPKLQVTLSADTLLCKGESTQLLVSGGQSYSWSPPDGLSNPTIASPECTPKTTTTYTVVARNGVCADTQRITIHVHDLPTVSALGDTTVCQNEDVILSVADADSTYTYRWYPEQNFVHNIGRRVVARSSEKKYFTVIATTPFGCIATDSVLVQIDNALTVKASESIELCPGETGVLGVSSVGDSSTTYTWFPNEGTFDNRTGTYNVQPTKSTWYYLQAKRGACVGLDSVYVTLKTLPTFTIQTDTALCKGTSIMLHVADYDTETTFLWLRDGQPDSLLDNPISTTPMTRSLLGDELFTVQATKRGCSTTKSLKLTIRELPLINAETEHLICKNESIELQIDAPTMNTIVWSPPYGLNTTDIPTVIATPDDTTKYFVTVTDIYGCSNTATITVNVKPRIPIKFTLNSASTRAGQDTFIVVTAWSAKEIITPISFDVLCDADVFDVRDSSLNSIRDSLRVISIHLENTALGNTPKVIASIKGRILLSSKSSTTLTMTDPSVNLELCPVIEKSPGLLNVMDCFYSQKAIQIIENLAASIMPNPVGNTLNFRMISQPYSKVSCRIINAVGTFVQNWEINPTATNAEYSMDVSQLSSGSYTLIVTDVTQALTLPFVKIK